MFRFVRYFLVVAFLTLPITAYADTAYLTSYVYTSSPVKKWLRVVVSVPHVPGDPYPTAGNWSDSYPVILIPSNTQAGDVNGDSIKTQTDYLLLSRFIVTGTLPTPEQFARADVGNVSANGGLLLADGILDNSDQLGVQYLMSHAPAGWVPGTSDNLWLREPQFASFFLGSLMAVFFSVGSGGNFP